METALTPDDILARHARERGTRWRLARYRQPLRALPKTAPGEAQKQRPSQ